jgi:hypothetical protein
MPFGVNLAFGGIKLSLLEDVNYNLQQLYDLDNKINKKLDILKNIKTDCKNKLLGVLQNRYKLLCDYEIKRYKLYLNENNIMLFNNKDKINNIIELDNNKDNILQLVWCGKSYNIKII